MPSTGALAITSVTPWTTAGAPRGAYARSVRIRATATQGGAWLTVADGDDSAGPRHGHLVRGVVPYASPLLASAGGRYQSLGGPVDPILRAWRAPMAAARAEVRLAQRAAKPVDPAAHKRLLITLVAAGP